MSTVKRALTLKQLTEQTELLRAALGSAQTLEQVATVLNNSPFYVLEDDDEFEIGVDFIGDLSDETDEDGPLTGIVPLRYICDVHKNNVARMVLDLWDSVMDEVAADPNAFAENLSDDTLQSNADEDDDEEENDEEPSLEDLFPNLRILNPEAILQDYANKNPAHVVFDPVSGILNFEFFQEREDSVHCVLIYVDIKWEDDAFVFRARNLKGIQIQTEKGSAAEVTGSADTLQQALLDVSSLLVPDF